MICAGIAQKVLNSHDRAPDAATLKPMTSSIKVLGSYRLL